MKKESYLQADVRIIGKKEHVEQMLNFLDLIDMCKEGCTRTFHIFYDGDGSARLSIKFPDGRDLVSGRKERWEILDNKLNIDFE